MPFLFQHTQKQEAAELVHDLRFASRERVHNNFAKPQKQDKYLDVTQNQKVLLN
jgi:hypothetical protein